MFQNVIRHLGKVNSAFMPKLLTQQFIGLPGICQKPSFSSVSNSVFSRLPALSAGKWTQLPLLQSLGPQTEQIRSKGHFTVIKFSRHEGKRLCDKEISKRFFRLDWGMWIRTKCGRHKKLWRKTVKQKSRLRQHVMCNATQCTLLDKMVNNVFKKKKYFVDDPYEPYHSREEHPMTKTKPRALPESAHSIVDRSP